MGKTNEWLHFSVEELIDAEVTDQIELLLKNIHKYGILMLLSCEAEEPGPLVFIDNCTIIITIIINPLTKMVVQPQL